MRFRQERIYWEHLFGRQPEEPEQPKPGYKNAIRPPWAPPEPPPLQVPPAILPGLVDLAEQADAVERVARCPDCGVWFGPWVAQTDDQFARGQLSIYGCSCDSPRHYDKQTARKLGLLE